MTYKLSINTAGTCEGHPDTLIYQGSNLLVIWHRLIERLRSYPTGVDGVLIDSFEALQSRLNSSKTGRICFTLATPPSNYRTNTVWYTLTK